MLLNGINILFLNIKKLKVCENCKLFYKLKASSVEAPFITAQFLINCYWPLVNCWHCLPPLEAVSELNCFRALIVTTITLNTLTASPPQSAKFIATNDDDDQQL